MPGPVVVGIDDFKHSEHLIGVAAREAELRGAVLCLAHAYHGFTPTAEGVPPGYAPEQVLRDMVEEQLAALAAKVRAEHFDLRVETAAMAGPAAPALARLAGLASLLVVGGRGRGGLTGQLVGSVSLGVLSHARCPVLVARGDNGRNAQRVMLGIDVHQDPRTGPEVLEFAFLEAARRHAGLYAFYAWENPAELYAYGAKIFAHADHAAVLTRGREKLEAALAPWQAVPGGPGDLGRPGRPPREAARGGHRTRRPGRHRRRHARRPGRDACRGDRPRRAASRGMPGRGRARALNSPRACSPRAYPGIPHALSAMARCHSTLPLPGPIVLTLSPTS